MDLQTRKKYKECIKAYLNRGQPSPEMEIEMGAESKVE